VLTQAGDAELMQGLTARNPFCLGLLFERYADLVLTLALRTLHDRSEAEEIVQEVFLHIFEKPHLFDPTKGTAKSWIARIATTKALDRRFYLARRGFYLSLELIVKDDALPSRNDLEREADSRQTRKHLERALQILTAVQRQTIESFFFQGLDLREISACLGEPLANVRHHLYRGLARLRKCSILRPLRK
jgi:RNA polymerase sigma-70 factor (ECF subfamily)